jgi:hypothetical protein
LGGCQKKKTGSRRVVVVVEGGNARDHHLFVSTLNLPPSLFHSEREELL